MNTKMKKELVNDVLTGLVVAAVFTAVMPTDAFAQLSAATDNAQASLAAPFIKVVSYISYAFGAVLSVSGIASAKKHADNPGSNPLGQALGKIGAGAAFLAAPSLIGAIAQTGTDTLGAAGTGFTTINAF